MRSATEVYEALAPAVLGYFRGARVRDPEDLTGDVFANVTRGLGRFHGDDAALRRWVFTIAHHRMVDEYRRAGRDVQVLTAEPPERAAPDPSAVIDEALTEALARLTDDQREVVLLRFAADLSLKDVATITGKRSGAVKMLQTRALDELRRILDS